MNENLEIECTEIIDRKKLATIERVSSLEPIEGKDRIEFIRCQGYNGVVQKGLHSVGDLVLVVKDESIVPNNSLFSFMEQFKFRVKSKSFNTSNGKIFSQIIVIPLSEVKTFMGKDNFEEGQDLTDELGIKKYIPKLCNATGTQFGNMAPRGSFPSLYVPKTDENNIQGSLAILEELQGLPYYITLKLEGASLTSLYHPELREHVVCSRNNMLMDTEGNSFWDVARKFQLNKFHKDHPELAIQGELCGACSDGSRKIQGNVMGLDDLYLYVFNIININTRRRLNLYDQYDLCTEYGLYHVPIYECGKSFNYTFNDLFKLVQNLRYGFGIHQLSEGIVVRPLEDVWSDRLKGSLSFKVKNPEYNLNNLLSQMK